MKTYKIELTEDEWKAVNVSAQRYDSTAKFLHDARVQNGNVVLNVKQKHVDNALAILREQGLTRDSGLTDTRYDVAMLPLLSHELCNKIFDGVDWGQLPDEVQTITVVIDNDNDTEFDPGQFAHQVFNIEYDEGYYYGGELFTLYAKTNAVVTTYAIETAVQKLRELVNGVD